MSQSTFTPGDANFEAFKFGDIAKPITPMALYSDCICGQRMVSITGMAISIDIPEGKDLVSRCSCGREYSITAQSVAAGAKRVAESDTVADAGRQALAAPVESKPATKSRTAKKS